MTVDELYHQAIKPLAAPQRLQLVRLILEDIPPENRIDCSEAWSDDDLRDFAQANWQTIDAAIGADNDAKAG